MSASKPNTVHEAQLGRPDRVAAVGPGDRVEQATPSRVSYGWSTPDPPRERHHLGRVRRGQRVLDAVPGDQLLRLGRVRLRLGREVGRLGLGQQRPHPVEQPRRRRAAAGRRPARCPAAGCSTSIGGSRRSSASSPSDGVEQRDPVDPPRVTACAGSRRPRSTRPRRSSSAWASQRGSTSPNRPGRPRAAVGDEPGLHRIAAAGRPPGAARRAATRCGRAARRPSRRAAPSAASTSAAGATVSASSPASKPTAPPQHPARRRPRPTSASPLPPAGSVVAGADGGEGRPALPARASGSRIRRRGPPRCACSWCRAMARLARSRRSAR